MDPVQLQNWPFSASATCYAKALTDADSHLALPVGGYFVHLVSNEPKGATLLLGAAAVAPTDGDGAVDGMVIPPGVPMTLVVRTAADLHGTMNATSALGTLYITKVR